MNNRNVFYNFAKMCQLFQRFTGKVCTLLKLNPDEREKPLQSKIA